MLIQKLQDDLTSSLKAKNQERLDTLRLLMADIKNAEIDSGTLSDEDILKILQKSVKKLNEASEMFRKGGREDLADQNDAQRKIIEEYLPEQMSDEELAKAIDQVIEENKELFEKNANAVIGIAMKKLTSQAEPARIMAELKKRS